MIQVCSQCGTRWNVRDKQRVWCPRCNGTLLAPAATTAQPAPAAPAAAGWNAGPRAASRLPSGYRWIAVRPGPPPPPRRRRRPLGPTPRYAVIPRWGLPNFTEPADAGPGRINRQAPTAARVRTTFFVAAVALGAAAVVHLVRYLLLVINRNTLLNWLVADAAALLSVLASLAAVAAVMACAGVLTRWLIARRAAAFEHHGRPDPRSRRALWVGTLLPPSAAMALAITVAVVLATSSGQSTSWALMFACVAVCCLPLIATVWALVYVIELARTEEHYTRLRPVIWSWWLMWLVSTVTSIFATVTSGAQDSQGIANNTVAMIVAYLLALVAVLATTRLFEGFERKPVERPAHRWVVVDNDGDVMESPAAVELTGEEPAA